MVPAAQASLIWTRKALEGEECGAGELASGVLLLPGKKGLSGAVPTEGGRCPAQGTGRALGAQFRPRSLWLCFRRKGPSRTVVLGPSLGAGLGAHGSTSATAPSPFLTLRCCRHRHQTRMLGSRWPDEALPQVHRSHDVREVAQPPSSPLLADHPHTVRKGPK